MRILDTRTGAYRKLYGVVTPERLERESADFRRRMEQVTGDIREYYRQLQHASDIAGIREQRAFGNAPEN